MQMLSFHSLKSLPLLSKICLCYWVNENLPVFSIIIKGIAMLALITQTSMLVVFYNYHDCIMPYCQKLNKLCY